MSRAGESSNAANQGQGDQGAQALGQKATEVGQNIREMGGQVREAATEKYEQLREQATTYYDQGRQRATEWEQGLESYVQEKPLQAVLMAAGVGVLLGLLWKRS
jgi:ElaB/YqjD/DUF883 family membrane-anchored ribosome-binding protein